MHIGPTRLLEVNLPNAKYDSKKRLHEGCAGVNWGDESEIEEAIAAGNNEDDDDEDSQEKTVMS